MSVKRMIMDELKIEKRVLERVLPADFPKTRLVCRSTKGNLRFFIKSPGSKRQKYVNRRNKDTLEQLYSQQLKAVIADILKTNIRTLEKALNLIEDYDAESIEHRMPLSYKRLRMYLEKMGAKDVENFLPVDAERDVIDPSNIKGDFPQSENPKDRNGLKFRTSFGLMVRSKNELLIAEALYSAGIRFLYEARLELVSISGESSSHETYNTEVLYPDFTIILPDGEIIYWEHLGMWEKKDYRDENIDRLSLYFANGIYPPKNMIITVDGNKMPFDNSAIWRVIEGMILSRY